MSVTNDVLPHTIAPSRGIAVHWVPGEPGAPGFRAGMRVMTWCGGVLCGVLLGAGDAGAQAEAFVSGRFQLDDRAAIVAAAPRMQSHRARERARQTLQYAEERKAHDLKRHGRIDWGPVVKATAEAVLVNPTPQSLFSCAEAYAGLSMQVSRRQPSARRDAGDLEHPAAMVGAALDLAASGFAADDALIATLRANQACIKDLMDGGSGAGLCRVPYL